MPQLILLGLVAVGGIFIWRVVKREMARVDEKVRKAKNVIVADVSNLAQRSSVIQSLAVPMLGRELGVVGYIAFANWLRLSTPS